MNTLTLSSQNTTWIKTKKPKIPQVLINMVWEYDGRYKTQYNKCIQDLTRYFNHSRMLDRIKGDIHIYSVYLYVHQEGSRASLKRYLMSFSKYVLSCIKSRGDPVPINNLRAHNLRKTRNQQHTENSRSSK